jgi:hypothetical protein
MHDILLECPAFGGTYDSLRITSFDKVHLKVNTPNSPSSAFSGMKPQSNIAPLASYLFSKILFCLSTWITLGWYFLASSNSRWQ